MKSYLKFLSRNKLYTAVEAAGLTASIAFVVLIGNYVWRQYRIAWDNPLGKSIYTVFSGSYGGMSWWDKDSFEEQLPEVVTASRLGTAMYGPVRIGDTPVLATMRMADAGLFELFPHIRVAAGGVEAFAAARDNCMISESFARAHFDGDAAGRQLTFVDLFGGENQTMTVCGIYSDFDDTLLGPVDILTNAAYDELIRNRPFSTRGQYITLLKVAPATDRGELSEKIEKICRANYLQFGERDGIYPVVRLDELAFIEKQYFVRHCTPSMLRILVLVVILLLVSAVFNYVNLNTALSGRRAKEMAMRRLLGSQRPAIFGKYIAESVAFTLVCTALALLVAEALRPALDTMLLNISVEDVVYDAWMYVPLQIDLSAAAIAIYVAGAVATGVVVGLVPAAMAMHFRPIDVVRGTFRRRTKMLFSRVFIIIQNTVSVTLIALSLVMEVQMHHMMTRPLHGRTDGLYLLRFWIRQYDDARPLVDRLNGIPGVARTGLGNGFPSHAANMSLVRPLNNSDRPILTSVILCDETYFELLGLEPVADYRTQRTNSVWMSESLANELSLTDSLQLLPPRDFDINGAHPEVYGGIYRDIPTTSASTKPDDTPTFSVVVIGERDKMLYTNGMLIEVTGDRRATAEAIKAAYAEYYTERYGMYSESWDEGYLDDVIAAQLRPVKIAIRLLEMFMLLSVVISLLGLVAMSTYHAGENTKSIAIRKVFGSNVRRELLRTVAGYMAMVAVAVAIGLPAAVWLAGRWLEQFAYRIESYRWIFVVAAAVSVAIAFASVFWQTWRAARTNPADELKKE